MDMGYNMGGGGLDLANLISSMMKNNEDGAWGGNGSWLWFLLILLIWGRDGAWGNGNATNTSITEAVEAAVSKTRANELSDQVILEAVNGNRTAISEVMSAMNCDFNQVNTALGQLNTAIMGVGNQIGLTSQQTINAVQQGNQNIIQQLCNCCCNLKELVATQFGDVKTQMSTGFGNLNAQIVDKSNAAVIQNMQQTTQLQGVMEAGFALMGNRFNDQAMATQKGFQEIKDMMNQQKIDTLQEKVTQLQNSASNSQQTAYLQNYVATTIAPIQATVNALYERSTPAPVPAYVVTNPNGTIPTCACMGA